MIQKKYMQLGYWPARLEQLTLADWAAWYDASGKGYEKKNVLDSDGLLQETANEQNEDEMESNEEVNV